MKITWLGHSCFKIESNGDSIIIDPYADGKVDGLKPLRNRADLVLCSHEHKDHNAREVITLTSKSCSFSISSLDTYHDDQKGSLRGKNRIHIVNDGTYSVAHLGDLGCSLSEAEISVLKNVDVLLIPVGGHYTIDAIQAKTIVDQVLPKITIPMHYRGEHFGYEVLSTVEDFTSQFDSVTIKDKNFIFVEENLNSPVIVLNLES